MEIVQINMKKAFVAAMELNRKLDGKKDFICLVTEPYRNRNKIAASPNGSTVCNSKGINLRASIFSNTGSTVLAMDHLCNDDCAVILLKSEGGATLIASVYLDINKDPYPLGLRKYVTMLPKRTMAY